MNVKKFFTTSLQLPSTLRRVNTETEIVSLAKAISRARREYEKTHGAGAAVKIDDNLSRILENDPAYVPYRARKAGKGRPPAQNPGIFTVQRIAQSLGTTVGELLGEPARELPQADQWKLAEFAQTLAAMSSWLSTRFGDAPPETGKQAAAGNRVTKITRSESGKTDTHAHPMSWDTSQQDEEETPDAQPRRIKKTAPSKGPR